MAMERMTKERDRDGQIKERMTKERKRQRWTDKGKDD